MANVFNTTEAGNLAKVTAELVGIDMGGLAALVSRHLESEYVKGKGGTVNISVPGAVPARSRLASDKTTAIVSDEIAEQVIPLSLTNFIHSAVDLSEADMSLEMRDYTRQVLTPQADAIQRASEAAVAAAMATTPLNTAIAYDETHPRKAFVAARKVLRQNGVSAESKISAVVGTNVYADLLDAADGKGLDDTGKIQGFGEIRESTRIPASEIFVFVKEAFSLAMVAPVVPDGAGYGASVKTENGAIRVIRDYNSSTASDRSLVGAFIAATALPLAVVNETAGTVALVPNAGVVRLSIADAEPV